MTQTTRWNQHLRAMLTKTRQAGFDDAIDKVLYYLQEEIDSIIRTIDELENMVKINQIQRNWLNKKFHERDALLNFKNLLNQLFKMVAVESKAHE